jgi:hypothetical protein
MKYHFAINLLCLYLIGNISLAQQKKPISPKKPTTTVKTTPAKTAPKTTVVSKPPITTTNPPTTPPKVEEKKPAKTNAVINPPAKTETSVEQPSSTTIQQSTGPMKGNKLDEEEVKEPRPKKIKTPKIPIEGGTIRFGVRAEVTQHYTLEVGGGVDLSPGINVGILANLPISEQVSIQPEVLYSIISIKSSTDDNNYVKSSIGSIWVGMPITD